VKAVEEAISRCGIKVARQTCLVYLKRRGRVRDALDLLLSLAESVPTRGSPLLSYILAPRELWPLLRFNNQTSPSTPPGELCHSPGGQDRPGHSLQLQPLHLSSHPDNITRTLISS
jgi:hypothetical protein